MSETHAACKVVETGGKLQADQSLSFALSVASGNRQHVGYRHLIVHARRADRLGLPPSPKSAR
ncbi:hypothetical protein [Rhizobium leguminosarum]|uniref:hypothetical protein n=1 Tax=Rhizobium leguminosarum TaxID=384 RepID=UPI001AE8027E|nr:hypothetical protein [Rhizobium leguminosarum]MBP2444332.1 hypothetical protein [Rhizobium leguminosarum]